MVQNVPSLTKNMCHKHSQTIDELIYLIIWPNYNISTNLDLDFPEIAEIFPSYSLPFEVG